MSVTNPLKTQNHTYFSTKKPCKSLSFYFMISLIVLIYYIYPFLFYNNNNSITYDKFSSNAPSISIPSSSNRSSLSIRTKDDNRVDALQPLKLPPKGISNGDDVIPPKAKVNEIQSTCDYTNGEWVHDEVGPLYNGSSCVTIKDGQNCMSHGRPDSDYLYWKWKPKQCNLSRFNPESFLKILEGKHVAFVGDSLARNQLESLLCMLASFSAHNLVYSNGEDNKFRRWRFLSYNVTVSVYWSPFLVKGVEKTKDRDYNRLFLDSVDERWASDLDSIDLVVFSIGHWYLLRAIYVEGGKELGCHGLEGMNCTDIGFYDPFGRAFNTSLKTIIQTKGLDSKKGIDVVVTTFSPHHFEGDWDNLNACSRKMPYKDGEKSIEGMNDILRRTAVEEVEKARNPISFPNIRLAALDVTKLSLMRPDGHPGPYMYYNPFADGIKERVHNDCVHWCLPGPIDTWNEIMLDIIKRWHSS